VVCIGNYGLLLNWSNRQRYRRREAECVERKVQKETLKGDEGMNKENKKATRILDSLIKSIKAEYINSGSLEANQVSLKD
jgi:hypothetical protein